MVTSATPRGTAVEHATRPWPRPSPVRPLVDEPGGRPGWKTPRQKPPSYSPAARPVSPAAPPTEQKVRFQALGPLQVVSGGRTLPLRGVNQRATLGYLLLNANRVVAMSELVKALWPQDAPPTARKMLQNAVSALRGMLARGGVDGRVAALVSQAPGYMLQVDPGCIDIKRFQALAEKGRAELAAGSAESAARYLRSGLSCWRGSVLDDLTEAGVDWPQLAVIRSARITAQEDFFEAELASGRHHEVMAELEAAVELDPDRERMARLFMLALYRCGRQTEALGVYRRLRPRLLNEFGLEPGRELQGLWRAIIRQDPSLELPTSPQHTETGPAAPRPTVAMTAPRQATEGARQSTAPAAAARPRPPEAALLGQEAVGRPRDLSGDRTVCPAPDRDAELELLKSLLALARRRRRPHMVTVLGERGTGKSSLVGDFRESLRRETGAMVLSVNGSGGPAAELCTALERRRPEHPLVVVCEGMHRAGDPALGQVGEMVRTAGSVPLLVVVTARPGFLELRPQWGEVARGSTTIVLERSLVA